MKAIKIILAILIFIAIIPCIYASNGFYSAVYQSRENIYENAYGANIYDAYDTLINVENAMPILICLTFIFFLSAGVIMLAMQEKNYAGFISGGMISTCIIFFFVCNGIVNALPNDEEVRLAIVNAINFLNTDDPFPAQYNSAIFQYLIGCILPTIGFFAVATFETIRKKRNRPGESADTSITVENATTDTCIDIEMANNETNQIRMFKQLFDEGIITQEEFDAKKKQLLGL